MLSALVESVFEIKKGSLMSPAELGEDGVGRIEAATSWASQWDTQSEARGRIMSKSSKKR